MHKPTCTSPNSSPSSDERTTHNYPHYGLDGHGGHDVQKQHHGEVGLHLVEVTKEEVFPHATVLVNLLTNTQPDCGIDTGWTGRLLDAALVADFQNLKIWYPRAHVSVQQPK